jgi:hypothetical protein
MVRVEAKAADLSGAPRHIAASVDDPPSAEILQGFDPVFLLSPAIEGQAELQTVFIDALVTAGHRPHVAKIAADGFQDPDCDVRFMRSHREIAGHLDAVALPVTYLAWTRPPVPYPRLALLKIHPTAGNRAHSALGRSLAAWLPGSPVANLNRAGATSCHGASAKDECNSSRILARHRLRVGPMLPTGSPSWSDISA